VALHELQIRSLRPADKLNQRTGDRGSILKPFPRLKALAMQVSPSWQAEAPDAGTRPGHWARERTQEARRGQK
jgi:hypothetical protein